MIVKTNVNNEKLCRYFLKRTIISIISSVCVLQIINVKTQANEEHYHFDPSLLLENGQHIDIEKFNKSSYIGEGKYLVNIFLNNNFYEQKEVQFKSDRTGNANPCFLLDELELMGIFVNESNKLMYKDSLQCFFIHEIIPNAETGFETTIFRLNLSVPQIYIKKHARGFVHENKFNSGSTMFFANYDGNYYKNKSKGYNYDYGFASIYSGFNLGLWQFRQQFSFGYTSTENSSDSAFNWIKAYVQRPIASIRSQLLAGEISSIASMFGSLAFRGIQLMSDDRMLPDSQVGYAPVIRGIARTTARVSIKQNGIEIYQTVVSPGEFEITDLHSTSYQGDLLVEVQEADGEINSFFVPFAAVPESIRPGHTRYMFSVGEIRNFERLNRRFIDLTVQRGLTNLLTLSGGIRVADKYQAAAVNSVFVTPLGAFSLQSAFSNADVNGQRQFGSRFGINYSRTLPLTHTAITLAGYRYSTKNFRELSDVLGIRGNSDNNQTWNSNTYNQESQMILHINQFLGKWGQLFTSGSMNSYYGNRKRDIQLQVGYSNTYNNIGYSLVYNQQKVGRIADNYTYSDQNDNSKIDKVFMFTISVPLGSNKNTPIFMFGGTNASSNSSYQANLSGVIGEDLTFNYSANADYDSDKNQVSAGLHLTKHFSEATVSGNFSKGENYLQGSMGVRGALVVHKKSITFGPYISDTFALIEAQGAQGAKVINGMGATINRFGYAIVSSLVPYKYNDIGLNGKSITDSNIELGEHTQNVIPYSGANVKLTFKTTVGYPILISIPQSELLPLGQEVYDEKKQVVGLVGQGNQIYGRVSQSKGTLFIANQVGTCRVTYDIPKDKRALNLILLNGTCGK